MYRLINTNPHNVHVLDPRTRHEVVVSPMTTPKLPMKVYEIEIEDSELPMFKPFIDLKMLKAEVVSPTKSPVAASAETVEKVGTGPVVAAPKPAGRDDGEAKVVATSAASGQADTVASVPARKVDGPAPGEIEKRLEKPALPRRKV